MKARKLRDQRKTKKQIQSKGMVIFALLCILLFYPPFFKGLFFEKEILITHILSFGLFIIYLVNKTVKGERISLDSPLDYLGLFFIGAYILPIIFKQWADLRQAIGLVFRYTNFFIVYLMVKDYAQLDKYRDWILDVFILSGGITALIGLLGAAGYVNLPDVLLGNRISSTFQYPNTLAAFLMTLFFITAGKQIVEEKLWGKTLYGIAGFIMVFTFIFTYSRTAWVIFPIFAIGYFLIVPKTAKADTLLYYIGIAVPGILLLQPFSQYASNLEEKSPRALMIVILGIGIFTILYILMQKFKQRLQARHLKLVYILVVLVIVGAGAFGTYAFKATEPLVFDNLGLEENKSNNVQRMVKDIEGNQDYSLLVNLEATGNEEDQWPWRIRIYGYDQEGGRHTLLSRQGELEETGEILIPFTTNQDTNSLAIYLDNQYPGTRVKFNQAQLLTDTGDLLEEIKLSYKYIPETIINRLNVLDLGQRSFTTRLAYYRDSLDIYKDYPIIGAGGGAWEGLYTKYQSEPYFSTEAHNYFLQTLVELGTLGIILLGGLIGSILLLLVKSIREKNIVEMTILFSILSLLTHSGLDFNFSYLSIPLFMWALLALVDSQGLGGIKGGIKDRLKREVHSLIPLFLVLPFIVGATSFYGGYQSALGGVYALQEEGDFQKGYDLLTRATGTDPFNKSYRGDLARLQMMIGEQNQEEGWFYLAEENLQAALKYAPYDDSSLQQIGLFYISHGQFDKGFEYIEKLLEASPLRPSSYDNKTNAYTVVGQHYLDTGEKDKAIEMFEKVVEVVGEARIANEKAIREMELDEDTMDRILKAKHTLENIDNQEKLRKLDDIIYISYFSDSLWTELPEGWWTWDREGGNVQTEMTKEGIVIDNNGEAMGRLLSPQIELQPSTAYRMDLELAGDMEDDFLEIEVFSRSGTSTQFIQRPVGKPGKDGMLSFNFTTTNDIDVGGQDIRFSHYGGSDKKVTVKQVIIYQEE